MLSSINFNTDSQLFYTLTKQVLKARPWHMSRWGFTKFPKVEKHSCKMLEKIIQTDLS